MGGNGDAQGGKAVKRLSPTAAHLVGTALNSFSGLFAQSCFADEIVNATADDFEDYGVLRRLVICRTYSDNYKQGQYNRCVLYRMLAAQDHTELCNALLILANHDIALSTALENEGVPNDGLYDCLWQEVSAVAGRELPF